MSKEQKLVETRKVVFEKDEKKSIIIALVVSAAVVLAAVLAFVAIKKNGNNNRTISTEVVDSYTTTETISNTETVTNQEELDNALAEIAGGNEDITSIVIESDEEQSLTISEGDYKGVTLEVSAPYTEVKNQAQFGTITLNQISTNTWTEDSTGNTINVFAPSAHIVVESTADVALIDSMGSATSLAIEAYGAVDSIVLESEQSITSIKADSTIGSITLYSKTSLTLSGSTVSAVPVKFESGAAGSDINASVPVAIETSVTTDIELQGGAESSTVQCNNGDVEVIVANHSTSSINVTEADGNVYELKPEETKKFGKAPVITEESTSASDDSQESVSSQGSSSSSSSSNTSGSSSSGSSSGSGGSSSSSSNKNTTSSSNVTTTTTATTSNAGSSSNSTTATSNSGSQSAELDNLKKQLAEQKAWYEKIFALIPNMIQNAKNEAAAEAKKEIDEALAEKEVIADSAPVPSTDAYCVFSNLKSADITVERIATKEFKAYDTSSVGEYLIIENNSADKKYDVSIHYYYFNSKNQWIYYDVGEDVKTLYPNGGAYVFTRTNPYKSTAKYCTIQIAVEESADQSAINTVDITPDSASGVAKNTEVKTNITLGGVVSDYGETKVQAIFVKAGDAPLSTTLYADGKSYITGELQGVILDKKVIADSLDESSDIAFTTPSDDSAYDVLFYSTN